jgi:5'-deoxynucleotidase YfbR-like HD superfamily hydrolase/nucleoside phosphorylase
MTNNQNDLHCDVLVMIALPEEFQQLEITGSSHVTTEFGVPIRHATLPAVNGDVQVAFALIGDMGNEKALNTTTQLLGILSPRLVVSLGISALLSEDWRLGDVVVGTETDNYSYRGKAVSSADSHDAPFESTRIVFGGRSFQTTHRWYKLLTGLHETDLVSWNKWVNDCVTDRYVSITDADTRLLLDRGFIRDDPFLAFGPLASGPLVSASKAFKNALKAGRNRNFVALDMESAGVVQAAHEHDSNPETLVIRGISDFGDERKSELDKIGAGVLRAWSTRNALKLLHTFLMHVDFAGTAHAVPTRAITDDWEALVEHLHRTISKEYLEYPYTRGDVDIDAHARLFQHVVQLPDGTETPDVFGWLVNTVWASTQASAVNVEGDAGTGKTALLAMLYWYVRRQWLEDPSRPVPVLVNLHRYNRSSKAGRTILINPIQATLEMRGHLQPLADLIARFPETQLFVIVDGFDNFARHAESLGSALVEICTPTYHRRIMGLRRVNASSQTPARRNHVDTVVTLHPMQVNSPHYKEYLDTFIGLSSDRVPALTERIADSITRFGFAEVDLFTLTLLLSYAPEQSRTTDAAHRIDSMAAFIAGFCQEHLQRSLSSSSDGALERAAEMAFHLMYTAGWAPSEDGNASPVFLDLSNRHPRIRDFLIAKHMLQVMRRAQEEGAKDKDMNNVYTATVNRVAKELMRSDPVLQMQLASSVHIILEDDAAPVYARAHAGYLAGRMTAPQAVRLARDFLTSFKDHAVELATRATGTSEDRQYLLLARTVYISLAYLEDTKAQTEYILKLLSDSLWDDINRGFHLEYYEDQPYVLGQPLVSTDKLEPCPKTFQHLYDRLTRNSHPHSYEINLHTFCSLSQHRHAKGLLSELDRTRAREVVDLALESDYLRTDDLRKYITMLQRHFSYPHFRIGHLFDDFYHIKFVKREGWVVRGLRAGESVADHMYGAYLLAMFLLPDEQVDDPSYSKEKVMKMLLIHDLAEARTGDILPRRRTEAERRNEKEVFDEIGLLGTYSGMAVLRDVAALWEEYRSESTINARVAKEIDKLENLVQLHVYHADGMTVDDYTKWASDLRKAVTTEPGRHVLGRLREFYEDSQRPPRHDSIPVTRTITDPPESRR